MLTNYCTIDKADVFQLMKHEHFKQTPKKKAEKLTLVSLFCVCLTRRNLHIFYIIFRSLSVKTRHMSRFLRVITIHIIINELLIHREIIIFIIKWNKKIFRYLLFTPFFFFVCFAIPPHTFCVLCFAFGCIDVVISSLFVAIVVVIRCMKKQLAIMLWYQLRHKLLIDYN